jgi:hypothetical protein
MTAPAGEKKGFVDQMKSGMKDMAQGVVYFLDRNKYLNSRVGRVFFLVVIAAGSGAILGAMNGIQPYGASFSFQHMSATSTMGLLGAAPFLALTGVALGAALHEACGSSKKKRSTMEKVIAVAFPFLVVGLTTLFLQSQLHSLGAVNPEFSYVMKITGFTLAGLALAPVLMGSGFEIAQIALEGKKKQVRYEELQAMISKYKAESRIRQERLRLAETRV